MAFDILGNAVAVPHPTSEQAVRNIQATPPTIDSPRPAQGPLADALRSTPDDPQFDVAVQRQEWATIEAEMTMLSAANSAYAALRADAQAWQEAQAEQTM